MVKKLLRRTLGRASLGYEEVYTILCEVESVINSRHLTYLSEDTEDLVPLTHAMFLQDYRPNGVPDINHLEETSLCKQLRVPATTAGGFEEKISRQVIRPSGSEGTGNLGRRANWFRRQKKTRVICRQNLGDVPREGWTCKSSASEDIQSRDDVTYTAYLPIRNTAEKKVGGADRGDDLQEEGVPNIPCGVKTRSGRNVRLPMKFKT
ncbi:hypothetical protein PR048_026376 [Dryococelus australis]|uniref:Neurotrophin-3 n=1 Tax=Dryococelus australis TaxID=614101 RepID=A0ABQ9GL49_9NEOP|nr:hypothetical protein PR048_026376 [Dryococelus australis]